MTLFLTGALQLVCAVFAAMGASLNIGLGNKGFAVTESVMAVICGAIALYLLFRACCLTPWLSPATTGPDPRGGYRPTSNIGTPRPPPRRP